MAILRVSQLALLSIWLTFISFSAAAAEPEAQKIFAVISKVEGSGTAKVRRVAGTESVVGQQMEIFAGDRIFTDDTSTVEVVLHDGTLIRIGIRSEFKLSEVEQKKGVINWVFGLANGTIRALVEKSVDKKTVKFRVNTPAGTMGIRGTEVTLEHRKDTGLTTLFTLEGKVEFGALDCAKANACVEVLEGKFSTIKAGDKKPSAPGSFTTKELLGLTGAGAPKAADISSVTKSAGTNEGLSAERLALFQGISRVNAGMLANMSEAEMAATLKAAQDQLAAAQDKLLRRSAETRLVMQAAMKAGTYNDFMKVADGYLLAKSGRLELTPAENIDSGTMGSRKFALAVAIVKSPAFSGERSTKTATKTGTATSTALGAATKAAVFSDDDIGALVSKGSASLQQATTWAKKVAAKPVSTSTKTNTNTATQTATSSNAVTNSKPSTHDPVVGTVSNYSLVSSNLIDYEDSLAAVNQAAGSTCNLLCAVSKLFNEYSGSPTSNTTGTSTSTSTYSSAYTLCANPVTTCRYMPCNTSNGKICPKPTKICKKTCK